MFHEAIGRRVVLAVAAMVVVGAALVLDVSRGDAWVLAGVVAVAAATLGWAIDNPLARPLAERDPLSVVAAKAGLGATFTLAAAVIAGGAGSLCARTRPEGRVGAVLVPIAASAVRRTRQRDTVPIESRRNETNETPSPSSRRNETNETPSPIKSLKSLRVLSAKRDE